MTKSKIQILKLKRFTGVKFAFVRNLIIFLFMFFSFSSFVIAQTQEFKFQKERAQMVDLQIKARGIKDKRVIDAMLKVKRHLFVPEDVRYLSYADSALPIGEGQTISQPYVVALMTELLKLNGSEKVLEIGTGSGYQAAVLGELSRAVYSVEIVKPLVVRSQKILKSLGYKNIKVKYGNGWLGWREYAPFNAIIVTCAPDEVPKELVKQLAQGGKMVIPVGGAPYQQLKLFQKKDGSLKEESVTLVRFVPMVEKK